MKIRRLRLSDIPHLEELVVGESAVEDYPGEYSSKVFKQMLEDKHTIVLVVIEEQKPIAFQEFKIDTSQKRIYLETLVVSKYHRGKGIAQKLMMEVEKIAKSKHLGRLSFTVRKWNKPMNSLAQKLGFIKKDELIFWDKVV